MTVRLGVAVVLVALLTGCGSSPKPGPCQNLSARQAQQLIQFNRYGAETAAWVSTGRNSQGAPVIAVAISTVQHQTLLLGHVQSPGSFSGGFWVSLNPTAKDATGFPGRTDGIVGDIADAIHSDDVAAVERCL